MKLQPHAATTRNVAGIYPFLEAPSLPPSVYIGADRESGASFCYDPFVLYKHGYLRGPNILVVGDLGWGKSSLVKTMIGRCSLHGRTSFVVSPKPGEYDALARSLGAELVRLEPGGETTVNPLTGWGTLPIEQLSRLLAISATILGRDLTPEEKAVARDVLTSVRADHGDVTIPRLAAAQGWGKAKDVRYALDDLCVGELAGMFDGPTTTALRLDGHVILDLGALWNSSALSVAMVAATGWMRAIVAAKDQHPRFLVVDEAWRAAASMAGAELLQTSTKNSRGYGLSVIALIHKLADLEVAADQGTRVQGIVAGLLADSETRIIFHQPKDQIPTLTERLGLTDTEADLLPNLGVGEALWNVGGRSFVVAHKRSKMEEAITDTDARMAG